MWGALFSCTVVISCQREAEAKSSITSLFATASQTEKIRAAQDTVAPLASRTSCLLRTPILPPSSHGHNIPTEVGRTSITIEEAVARIG